MEELPPDSAVGGRRAPIPLLTLGKAAHRPDHILRDYSDSTFGCPFFRRSGHSLGPGRRVFGAGAPVISTQEVCHDDP
jgi:hypothetical protein